jgi:hypothetical protein
MQTLAKTWSSSRYRKLRGFGVSESSQRQEEGFDEVLPDTGTIIEVRRSSR